ncbi:MAG: oligosaccharide flippase family protein [Planctomycetota bacterium]
MTQRISGPTIMVAMMRGWFKRFATPTGKRVTWNLGCLIASAIISQICGVISVLLLTSAFGTGRYGTLSFALSLQGYMMILGSAGLRPIVVRELTRDVVSLNQIWSAFLSITLALGVVLGILMAIAAWLLAPTPTEALVISLIGVGNVAACANLSAFFDYRHAQSSSGIITAVAEVAALIAIAAFYFSDTISLPLAAAVFSLKWIVMNVLLWVALRRHLPSLRWEWSAEQAIRLTRSSWKLVFSSLLATIPFTAGVILVRLLQSEEAAGVFAVAMYAPRALFLLVGQVNRIMQPYIMGEQGQQRSFVVRTMLAYPLFLLMTALCSWCGLWFAVTFLLDPEFHDALTTGSVLLIGAVLLAGGTLCTHYLIAKNAEHLAAISQFATAVVYLTGALLMIPEWSIDGASWAFVAAACTMAIGCAISLSSRHSITASEPSR